MACTALPAAAVVEVAVVGVSSFSVRLRSSRRPTDEVASSTVSSVSSEVPNECTAGVRHAIESAKLMVGGGRCRSPVEGEESALSSS